MRRLGDYELLRKIGVGGMAEVWMGRRAAMAGASKAVAIKLLARDLLDDPSYRQMFIEEARLSMLLTNSNVVQVFDVGEIDGECFMVMEWVDGLNLSELARKMLREGERLSTLVAAHVTGEVLRALAYAHGLHHDGAKATIVHRDVSPQNVIVSVSGEVKLADFGVARLAREETSGLHVKGKLRYMAPEQLRGRSREPTVDLYAVGAILHELLEGERFRKTRDEGDLYAMVLNGEYPPLTVEVPPELIRLHAALLNPDPARRIQSADEALELLYSWPDYRNSSMELGRLVRRWIGVAAPRSGILSSEIIAAVTTGAGTANPAGTSSAGQGSEASTAVASGVETLDVPTRAASGPTSVSGGSGSVSMGSDSMGSGSTSTAIESGPVADRGATETHTFATGRPEIDATAVIAGSGGSGGGSAAPGGSAGPGRPAAASSMMIVAALTLALSFGVFGLGFPLGWWDGGDAQKVAVVEGETEGEAAEAELPETEAEPETAKTADTGKLAKTAEITDLSQTDTGDDGGQTGDDSETGGTTGSQVAIVEPPIVDDDLDKPKVKPKKQPPPPPQPPAHVDWIANDFNFVFVKVAGKQLVLEPVKDIDLKPGKHRVYLRQDPDDDWQSAGTIKLEPGKRYEARMTKPAGVKLKKL